MQGCGNDFILFDDREGTFSSVNAIPSLCHRHEGIGADGVILLQRSEMADFRMRLFNADGSPAAMCGNGLRCLILLCRELGISRKALAIETRDGVYNTFWQGTQVSLAMHPPSRTEWHLSLQALGRPHRVHLLCTGVPHAVLFVDDVTSADVLRLGPALRHHPDLGPEGANVDFVEMKPPGVKLRTYERGVEAETLACGTGATAAALSAAFLHGLPSPIHVQVASGKTLTVSFERKGDHFEEIFLKGEAVLVFTGSVEL